MDELKTLFGPSSKKKREDEDLFAVSEPSTSKEAPKMCALRFSLFLFSALSVLDKSLSTIYVGILFKLRNI